MNMGRELAVLVTVVLLIGLIVFSSAAGGESCGWYSFRQNSGNTGTAVCAGPDSPDVLWTLNMSSLQMRFDSTPAIDPDRGVAYLGGSYPDIGEFFALDLWGYYDGVDTTGPGSQAAQLDTAEVLWSLETDRIQDSSAAIDGEHVYFADLEGIVRAVEQDTGKESWSFDTGREIHSSPVLIDDTLLIGSYSSKLHLLNISSGDEIWNHTMSYWVHATPAVYKDRVYAGFCGASLDIINLTSGELNQKFECRSYIISSPSVYGDNVYFGDFDGYFYSMKATNNEENWNVSVGTNIYSSPAVAGGMVYFGSNDGSLYAYHTENGTQAWKFKTAGEVKSSPAVAGDTVYVGSADGFVYALDAKTGAEVWKYNTGSAVAGSPAIANGLLVVATTGGLVIAFGELNGKPEITATWPGPAATGVPVNTTIELNFSLPMNHSSAESNLTIIPAVDGSFSWDNNTLVFTPNGTLDHDTNYTIVLGANATSLFGEMLGAEYNWSFITGSAESGGGNGGGGGKGQIIDEEKPDEDSIVYKLTPILEAVFIMLVVLLVITLIAYGIWFVKKNR